MSIGVGRWVRVNAGMLKAAVIASLVAGVPAGLLGRAAMAVIANAGGTSMTAPVGQLTIDGTARIMVLPMVFGIPFAFAALWLGRRAWRDRPFGVRLLAYGLTTLVLPGLLVLTDSEFHVPGANEDIGRLAFAPAFIVYGVLVGAIGERILVRENRAAPAPS